MLCVRDHVPPPLLLEEQRELCHVSALRRVGELGERRSRRLGRGVGRGLECRLVIFERAASAIIIVGGAQEQLGGTLRARRLARVVPPEPSGVARPRIHYKRTRIYV